MRRMRQLVAIGFAFLLLSTQLNCVFAEETPVGPADGGGMSNCVVTVTPQFETDKIEAGQVCNFTVTVKNNGSTSVDDCGLMVSMVPGGRDEDTAAGSNPVLVEDSFSIEGGATYSDTVSVVTCRDFGTVGESVSIKASVVSDRGVSTSDELQGTIASISPNEQIFRLYCPVNGEHLYTTDFDEVFGLVVYNNWNYEGVSWFAPSSGTPVYRLYNPGLQNHLYTSDVNEVNVLTSQHGWQSDNNGQPVFYSGGDVQILRLYNRELRGLHLWTTDDNEYNVLPGHGWTQEGVAFKGMILGSSAYPYPF